MGEARRRGTFEERKAQAIARKEKQLEERRRAMELQAQEEELALEMLTPEQYQLSVYRYQRIQGRSKSVIAEALALMSLGNAYSLSQRRRR